MKNILSAAVGVLVVFGVLVFASSLHAQTGQRVTVVNPSTQPVPVSVVGTPTVNATVTGDVGITGTPTVNANVAGEVSITGTPTVNANVTGDVGILGTPTVDIRSTPGVSVGFYFTTCSFSGPFCQSAATKQALPGTAFRIDAIQARTFGSSSSDLAAILSLEIVTPGLSAPFEVACQNILGFAHCNATPGITVTDFNGFSVSAVGLPAGGAAARVIVFFTVVNLAP